MARKNGKVVPVKPKQPSEMQGPELEEYLNGVGKEIDRLLERRGCVLDVQPALASSPDKPGTYSIGVVARILLKKP